MAGENPALSAAVAEADLASVDPCLSEKVQDEAERSVRSRIVKLALTAAIRGSHYLTGCFGCVPYGGDPVKEGRHLHCVNTSDWDKLAIHTACTDFYGHGLPIRCMGRFAHPDIHGGGALSRHDRRHLKTQLEVQGLWSRDARGYAPFRGLYPRRITENANAVLPDRFHGFSQSEIYLGEDCMLKFHFDCVGLVDFVLTTVGGQKVEYGIAQYRTGRCGIVDPVTPPPASADRLVPGDILTRDDSHIGFVGVNEHVVDAFGEKYGVVCRNYKLRNYRWTTLCRLNGLLIRRAAGAG